MDRSVGERTIADFGDQWTAYTDNSGFYGSSALLQDVFGPLMPVEAFSGLTIADIGAGTGRFTAVFANAGAARVTAVEPSAAFDALVRNTAAFGPRVECLNMSAEQYAPQTPVDFAFSYGVLHHIPEPDGAVAAMYRALKPGGRIGVWLYGYEGNALYVSLLDTVAIPTRRLPHVLLAAAVWLLYVPTVIYMTACRVLPLPLAGYFREVFAKLTPAKRRLTLYDQLNPSYAKYYREHEVRTLLERAGFTDIQVFHRHGYSWTALATRR